MTENPLSLGHYAKEWLIWRLVFLPFSQPLRLILNLILTRFFFPEVFGLMSLASIVTTFLHIAFDFGFYPSVIQNRRGDDPVLLNTVWTTQIILGLVSWTCCSAAALPFAKFYNQPQLLWLLPLMGLIVAIASCNSTAPMTLGRHMKFRKLFIFEFGTDMLQLVITLAWAWYSRSIWALVGGGIVGASCKLIWSHRLIPDRPNRLAWDVAAIKSIGSFGIWIWILGLAAFFSPEAMIMSKLADFEKGSSLYRDAAKFLSFTGIFGVVQMFNLELIFPYFARQIDLPRAVMRARMLQIRKWLLVVCGLIILLLAGFGDILVSIIYDVRLQFIGEITPILSIGLFWVVLAYMTQPFLWALARPRYFALGQLLQLLVVSGGMFIGFRVGEVAGMITAIALSQISFYAIVAVGLQREGLSTLKQDFQATGIFLGALGLIWGGRLMMGMGLPFASLLRG
jgi:O-antigen/teichoic acid export membrane protein